MTTYTLTAEQLHNLMALIYDSVSTNPKWIADREYAAQMLRSLQPNTQEPALYQSRIRPAWKDDADWFAWETCSRESAEAYERTPLLHDWQYQVRRLYAHLAPKDSDEPRLSDLFCGVDVTEGMLSVSVLRRLSDDVAEVLHSEQFELPQAKPLTDEQIKEIMLANGFNIKDGLTDLKPYVYAAARAIEAAHGIKP